jgi:hypothetical protein
MESGTPLSGAVLQPAGWLLQGVPVKPVRQFLAAFGNHPASLLTDPGPISRYIEGRENDELALWDVLVPSINDPDDTIVDLSLGIPVNCPRRTAGTKSEKGTLRITNKQRVASRGVEKTGLSTSIIADAEREYREHNVKATTGRQTWNYPDRIYRSKRTRPLLIVHLLRILDQRGAPMYEEPVVAWSISFPRTNRPEQRVEYVVTTTWLRENFREDVDEDELERDDD